MTQTRLATVANLRRHLIDRDYNVTAGFAELAGHLATDPTIRTILLKTGHGRPLSAAFLWLRIADRLAGQPRAEALGLAATFAFTGGNPGITATLINRADIAARRDHIASPSILTLLKADHRVREHLAVAV